VALSANLVYLLDTSVVKRLGNPEVRTVHQGGASMINRRPCTGVADERRDLAACRDRDERCRPPPSR
jgi:hypothetical protein